MLDRTSAPPFVEINSFNLPSPEIHVLSNQLPLIHTGNTHQEILKLEFIFEAGKWYESKKGVSYFTAYQLEKGTATRSSYQLADFFDSYGASLEISPGPDFTSVSLYMLTMHIQEVFPVFLEVLTAPTFPEKELALSKGLFIQTLKINNEKNSVLASKKIRQHVFGYNHAYGSASEEQDVTAITHHDLRTFFDAHYSLQEVYLTGTLEKESFDFCTNLLSRIPTIRSVIPKNQGAEFVNSFASYDAREQTLQTSIRLGRRTITRQHADYPTLILLNQLLGGYFGSRLMKNIREEKGLTYGISSSIHAFRHDALFSIGADVNKANRELVFSEIRKELDRLITEPIPVSELDTAKNHLLGSLQIETANPFAVAEKIKTMRLFQLPTDFYAKLFNQIRSTGPDQLQECANTYLTQKSMFEVSVG